MGHHNIRPSGAKNKKKRYSLRLRTRKKTEQGVTHERKQIPAPTCSLQKSHCGQCKIPFPPGPLNLTAHSWSCYLQIRHGCEGRNCAFLGPSHTNIAQAHAAQRQKNARAERAHVQTPVATIEPLNRRAARAELTPVMPRGNTSNGPRLENQNWRQESPHTNSALKKLKRWQWPTPGLR